MTERRALTAFASPDKWEALFGANYLLVLAFFEALRLRPPQVGDMLEYAPSGRWIYSAAGGGGALSIATKDFQGDGSTTDFVIPGIEATKAIFVAIGAAVIQYTDLNGDPQWTITAGGGNTTISFAQAPPAPDEDQPQGTMNIQVAVA